MHLWYSLFIAVYCILQSGGVFLLWLQLLHTAYLFQTQNIFIYHGTDPVWMLLKSVHYSKCHFPWTGTELYWQAHYQGLLTDRMNDCGSVPHCQSLTEWVQKLSTTFGDLKDSELRLEKRIYASDLLAQHLSTYCKHLNYCPNYFTNVVIH